MPKFGLQTCPSNLAIDGGTLKYTGAGESTARLFTIGANGATIDASAPGNAALDFTGASLAASGAGDRTLTLTGASTGANSLASLIVNPGTGTTAVTKSGNGTWTLAGSSANTYTGLTTVSAGELGLNKTTGVNAIAGDGSTATTDVTVSGGTLKWLANNQIGNTANIELNGGTLNTNGLSEATIAGSTVTPGLGALTLSTNSTLDLGTGASVLAFSNSSAQTWNGLLSIYNWTGTFGLGGGTDQVYFGTDTSGLLQAQLDQISFYSGPVGSGTFLGTAGFAPAMNGEIVPIPEPGTVFAGLALIGLVGWRERRRLSWL